MRQKIVKDESQHLSVRESQRSPHWANINSLSLSLLFFSYSELNQIILDAPWFFFSLFSCAFIMNGIKLEKTEDDDPEIMTGKRDSSLS